MSSFQEFKIDQAILKAIQEMGFEEPSPIQSACIPKILEGFDVIGQAQTGTGKTAAFGIPIVEKVTSSPEVQALVLTPTRELAIQISGELRKISKFKRIKTLPIYGGQSIGHQIRALKQGVQVVIGTPGRIIDHLNRKTLKLDHVRIVVLDEADEMLDMGFIDDIESILRSVPADRQTLLFSATMPAEIRSLANRYMKDPQTVRVNREEVAAPLIEQVYYKVLEKNKLDSLCRVLDSEEVELGIIFCRTKKGVDELTESLQARGYLADGLHGDLSQAQRDKVMGDFRTNRIELLIATDVAARGIDVSNVSHVINYDIPQDPESYVHRIGRTGRAGKRGIAITLVTPREMKQLKAIEHMIKTGITPRSLPTIEETNERKVEHYKQEIIDVILDKSAHPMVKEMVDQLKGEYPLEEIAYAIAHLAMNDQFVEEGEGYDFGETGAQQGMVRFFINVGKNINLSPKSLAEELASLAGISPKSIGKIDIFDRFTFVEVPEESAPYIYEALRQGRLRGTRVNVEPAKPRGK
ncbi:DEAD/DEAH box helicase [Thermicanus aegyptius]|uniref:DEAD/DEAH box helicase n=1 Tax=Thermicanus aegyptius TaxID=94009 RepID=UPI00034B6468|nr:DEAD/DEAH box helicase [Thermicanus aegyptius]